MKSVFFILLILISSGMSVFAQNINRIEGSPYPASAIPEKLFLVSESLTHSRKVVIQSLQGMLARTKPEILRDTHGHADLLKNVVTIDDSYYTNFNGLMARYANRFNGYILCEARTASVNVAYSLCPVLNAIAVPADIEQTIINAGYTRLLDVRGKDEIWLLANYGNQLSKSIASYQDTNGNKSNFLADYSIFTGALQFWDSSASGQLATSVYNRMDPMAVYFGWGPEEFQTVEKISQKSAMIHPSDWSPNLSTLTNIPVKLPRQKAPATNYEVVPNVHTVCFVISDGDNIQWLSGSHNNVQNWAHPDKAKLKLGWTISPAFAELAPVMYRKFIENALSTQEARNYLIAGPSGLGYYFPSIYPELAVQTSLLNRMMKKADLNIVNIIDKDGFHRPDEYLKQPNVDALFYYSYGNKYTGLRGEIKWYKDKPSIGGRFALWADTDNGTPESRDLVSQALANQLNQQSTDIFAPAGYSLVPVHIWSMNPADVLNTISKLNPNIRVVSPDEFVWLIRKNVRRIDIGNGNGLSAEYRLASNPDVPVLKINEPTIDLDDDYLTEGTKVVGTNDFTVIWKGEIKSIYSEIYTFHVSAKGGMVVKINGHTLLDSINNQSVNSSKTISLEAGKVYPIEVSYSKKGTKTSASVEWESTSQVRQRIPRYQLFSAEINSSTPSLAAEFFSIYPNPATTELRISGVGAQIGSRVVISDLSGRIVNAFTIDSMHYQIAVSDLPKGIYFFRLSNSAGSEVKKIHLQ